MNRRHPHTPNFYRIRLRNFCRRWLVIAFLLFLLIASGLEQARITPWEAVTAWLLIGSTCPPAYTYGCTHGARER